MINTITKHISLQRMAFVFALLFFFFSIFACDTTIQIGGSIFIGIILLMYSSGVNPSKIKAWILQSGFEPESYQPHTKCVKLLTCSDFLENCCVTCHFDTARYLLQINAIFPVVFPKPQSTPDEMRTVVLMKIHTNLRKLHIFWYIFLKFCPHDDILR